MKKKIISWVLSFIILLCFPIETDAFETDVSAKSAVLMCVNTGEVLFAKNEHKKLSMASTTKIMTSLIALEEATPDKEITVTSEMVSVEGTSMGLKAGDSVSLRELVYGMMLQSGNDAANTVALVLGETPEGFAEIMNSRAKRIGMKNSNFVTASGLDDEEHYSTAYDMALLAAESIKNPEFRFVCSQKSARLTYGNPPYARILTNHNRLLWRYSDSIGIKTGFTKKSGRCLVSAAERNGIILVAVTLNAGDDWNDHITMFEHGFSECGSMNIGVDLSSLSIKIAGGSEESVPITLLRDCILPENKSCYYSVYIRPFEYAPVKKGQIVGTVIFVSQGRIVDEIPIVTNGESALKVYDNKSENKDNKKSLFSEFRNKIKKFTDNAFVRVFRGERIGR